MRSHLRVIHTMNHSATATAVVAMRRVRSLKRLDQGYQGDAATMPVITTDIQQGNTIRKLGTPP